MYKFVVVTLAFLLMTTACTKQREAQFAQGQGENLLNVSDYNGKTFEITTGSAIEGQKQSFSKAESLDVKSKTMGDDAFSVVSYEVNDPMAKKLLGDTPIVGKKHKKYKGLIRVEQNYLKVYKVAPKADLPINEITYATPLENGDFAVPLIGYPVTGRITVERARNDLGESTSTKIEHQEEDMSKATQFRMDMSRGEIFEAVMKTDVLPTSYFDGEWYYNETVTSAPEEESESLGSSGGYDQTLTPSTRIKFIKDESSLKVVNLNIDQRLIKKEDVNFKTALTIPVEWKSYKVANNGKGMAEAEDSKIHWSKRPYLSVNFGSSRSGMNKGEARLVALEVNDEYLSYAVEDKENNMRIRYSFMRVKQTGYKAKRLFKDDKRLFGYFETEKQVVKNYEVTREEDVAKNLFISRFNTASGKIVYHFTKTTPQWIRPSVREAVKGWDDAFKAAGSKVDIVLDETFDVELGDLRYNAINIIENLTASNLFGFGPSVTDPFTGEIISATTNVHFTPIREAVIDELRTYIDMKLGRLNGGRLVGVSGQLKAMGEIVASQVNNKMQIASDFIPAIKGLKLYVPDDKNPNQFKYQDIDFRKRTTKNAQEFDVAIASGNIHKEIEALCPEMTSYVATLVKNKVTHNDDEIKVLDECSRKVAVLKFQGTLTHEMGHNFGLRHNFMASNDYTNFWSTKESGTANQVRSSSVMEYPSFNEDRLVKPGKYDIAAIRFGYVDAVETKDGALVSLDTNKTIAANLSAKSTSPRSFKFCTDEDVYFAADPMCQRHDAGVTPLEVTRNLIADYQASFQLLNFRRDALHGISPTRLMFYRMNRFFLPLVRFYEEWRVGLSRYVGQDEQYLERMDAGQLEAVITKMSADPQYAEFVKQYRPVAKEVFNFLMQIATLDNKYCLLTDANKKTSVIELSKVRQQMFYSKNAVVYSCADAEKAGFWSSQNLSVAGEMGYDLETFKYNMASTEAMEPNDVVGTELDRLLAVSMLTEHFSGSYNGMTTGFAPSFMDEPVFRKKLQDTIYARVTSGVPGASIARYLPESMADFKKQVSATSFTRFSAEQDLLKNTFISTTAGSIIPGKEEASASRLSTLSGIYTTAPTQELISKAITYTSVASGYFIIMDQSSTDAIKLVNKYNDLRTMKAKKNFDVKNAQNAKAIEILKTLPSAAELEKMSVGLAYQAYDKVAQDLQAAKINLDSIEFLLGDMSRFLNGVASLDEVQKSQPDVYKKIMEMDTLTFAKQALRKQTGFRGSDDIDAAIANNNKIVANYEANRIELDTQLNLLRNLISYIATNY